MNEHVNVSYELLVQFDDSTMKSGTACTHDMWA